MKLTPAEYKVLDALEEIFVFYRDGQPFHLHTDRGVFEEWMKTKAWLYPPGRCEIVRYVLPATSLHAATALGKRSHSYGKR
jgi:hypothetical protein